MLIVKKDHLLEFHHQSIFNFYILKIFSSPYEKYIEYIETQLQQETPIAYGLHPNAEIGFRTAQCISLFNLLIELQPKETGGEDKGDVKSPNDITSEIIKELFDEKDFKNLVFNLDHIKG